MDPLTGELMSNYAIPMLPIRRNKGRSTSFVKTYQDAAKQIRGSLHKLQGNTLRIFIYFIGELGYLNILPAPSKTSKDMCIKIQHTYKAYKELQSVGIVILHERTYYLDPYLAWKGTDEQWDELVEKLYPVQIQAPSSKVCEPKGIYLLKPRR